MKVVKKKGENGMIHLDVTASTAEVSEALNNAGVQFCNQMGIPPVPDKTPAQAAAEQMGIKDLDSLVVQQAVEALVPKAISKHNIQPAYMPIAQPKGIMRRGRTFQFELDVMPKPQYELTSYEPVSFTVDPFESDEEAVDREIAKMAEMYSGYVKTDDKPIEKGDNALLKIEAWKDGEVVPGLTVNQRTYSVGEGYMPVGFDDGIMGMVPGEVRTFKFEGSDSVSTNSTSASKGSSLLESVTDERTSNNGSQIVSQGTTIQEPITSNFSVYTTVNVPDGGTALLGGIKSLSEGRSEGGVPILSKIPYVKRLFSNSAIGRETTSMLMTVTPRIIIQEEEEEFATGLNAAK